MNEQNPNNNQQAPQQTGAEQSQAEQQQPAGRKPDHGAYSVQNPQRGGSVWNRVGAAWAHKDGKGFDVKLDSTPVNGRITVRELREQAHEQFDQQQISQGQEQQHDQNQSQDQSQTQDNNTYGRSR